MKLTQEDKINIIYLYNQREAIVDKIEELKEDTYYEKDTRKGVIEKLQYDIKDIDREILDYVDADKVKEKAIADKEVKDPDAIHEDDIETVENFIVDNEEAIWEFV